MEGEALGVVNQCGFECAVGPRSEVDFAARDARDRHNGCVFAVFETRHRGLDQTNAPHQVDIESFFPGRFVRCNRERADIGDDDVDPTERLRGARGPGLEGVAITHIGNAAHNLDAMLGEIADRALDFVSVTGAKRHVHAFGG